MSARQGGVPLSGPIVNSEEMHKATLAKKVQAFETAAKFKVSVQPLRDSNRLCP